MCGIVGVITSYENGLAYDEAKVFRDMLLIDTLRGMDSTGVFGVDHWGNVETLKEASNGASFVKTVEYNAFDTWLTKRGMFVVGHNRAATRGVVSDKNAHPFVVEDNIILVQNGTYKGDHSHHKDTDVDTEAVAHVIHENEDVETALQKINAAYALVWYNVKTRSLNIIRNEERPLFIAYTKNDAIVFASEQETILAACSRNNVELKARPYLLKESMLNTWTLLEDKKEWAFDNKKIDYKYRGSLPEASNDMYSFYGNYNTKTLSLPWKNGGTADEFEVKTTIFEYIHRAEFKPMHMSIETASICKDTLQQSHSKTLYVEFVDYKPCNTAVNCKAWFIIFNTIDPNDKVSPLLYTLIKDKTEKEIIEMNDANAFYLVDVGTTPIEHSVSANHNERKRLISLFVTNPTPVQVQ